jgi:flagellar biosynthesis protein FlhG
MTMPAVASTTRGVILAVTSGKGGVGKTSLAVNVSVALARLGHRVAVVDADFGLGNVDVMLGLAPEVHVGHLLSGEKSLREVLMEGPRGVGVLPAGSGLQPLTTLSAAQRERLTEALDQARAFFDFLVVDTAAGISDNVVETLKLAEHVLLMTSLDPAALVDAYAVAKVLWKASPSAEIGLVVNGVRDGVEGRLAFRQIDMAAARFLGHHMQYFGFIPDDPALREATLIQRPIVDHLPQAPASRCFRLLATRLATLRSGPGGMRLVDATGPIAIDGGVPQCA